MLWRVRWRLGVAGFLLCLLVAGCVPSGDNQVDEKKDPNFISGKNSVEQMDFPGAIDSFEKALEVNPRSGSAHFELAWIFENKLNDPAAAIYHYERYLKCSGDKADKADLVRQHINGCKLELAKTVSAFGPLPSPVQRDLEHALAQKKELEVQLAQSQAQVTQLQTQLAQARAVAAPVARPALNDVTDSAPIIKPVHGMVETHHLETPHNSNALLNISNRANYSGSSHSYVVRPGESFASIARKYKIPLQSMLAANPATQPNRLKAGQTVSIPAN